jgi:hypothetical protein
MTKVLARKPCCLPLPANIQLHYGEENLLDDLHGPRPARRFHAAPLVGSCGHHSRPFHFMVDRLPQQLVLLDSLSCGLRHSETAAGRIVASRPAGQRPSACDRAT